MELIWKELPGERIIYTGVSQGTVEGGIPLPEGRSAKEILSYTGEVAISSSSAREGEIAIEGVVRIDLICMDDKVFAFTSSAPFTHRIAADVAIQTVLKQIPKRIGFLWHGSVVMGL